MPIWLADRLFRVLLVHLFLRLGTPRSRAIQVKNRMWGASEYVASTTKCQVKGPCKDHTATNKVTGCSLTGKMTGLDSTPATLNYIIFMTIVPMYVLLVLYNLFFKLGAFKGGIANKEYIQALQKIQTARWYRTYTSIVLVISLALIVFGAYKALDASGNTLINHLAGSIALIVLIPSPRRIAAKVDKIEYNGDAVKKNRKSAWLAITTMFNWDTSKYVSPPAGSRRALWPASCRVAGCHCSTAIAWGRRGVVHVLSGADVCVLFPVPAQYEEAGRIEQLEKLGDDTLQEIKNYIEIPFLCG